MFSSLRKVKDRRRPANLLLETDAACNARDVRGALRAKDVLYGVQLAPRELVSSRTDGPSTTRVKQEAATFLMRKRLIRQISSTAG